MSVDYRGHFGIGVKLESIDLDELGVDSYDEYLHEIEQPEMVKFDWFEVGDSNYSGKEDDVFVIIRDPFELGIDSLSNKCAALEGWLMKNAIKYQGKIDCVGGLETY